MSEETTEEEKVEADAEEKSWESAIEDQNRQLEYYKKEIEIAKLKKELKELSKEEE